MIAQKQGMSQINKITNRIKKPENMKNYSKQVIIIQDEQYKIETLKIEKKKEKLDCLSEGRKIDAVGSPEQKFLKKFSLNRKMIKEEGEYHLILKKELEKKQKELNEEEMKKINQYNQMVNEKRIREEEAKKQKLIKAQEENKKIEKSK